MQSTHGLRLLPVVLCLAAPLAGQTTVRVAPGGDWFYQTAAGKQLAQVEAGTVLTQEGNQGDWVQVTLEGWIFGTSVGASALDGFDLAVTHAPTENLRATPGGTILARLLLGFGLTKLGTQGRWVHVRRQGWMKRSVLTPVRAASGASPVAPTPAGPSRDTTAAPSAPSGLLQAVRTTTLYRAPAPDSTGDATVQATAPLRVLGRAGDWTRVQLEGWVKSADLASVGPGVRVGVSAAEVRADPQRYVGQTLRWTLQVIAVRTADELRPDIPIGAMYLLARGPLPEHGFVYAIVPDAQRALVSALPSLATIQATVRVRTGRSRFIGNPVVDLVTLEELEP
jgi:hypothetical protein